VNSPRIVLFDIDGTLMRGAGPQHKEALVEGAHSVMGVRCTLDNIDTSGRLDRDLISLMLSNAGIAKRRIVPGMTRIMEAVQIHYAFHCRADFSGKLCPGVKDTLELLADRGIPIGLVTGNLSAIAWRKLQNAQIDHYFSFGAFAEQGTTRARLAKIALWQARRKGLAANGCSVTLIGDHANDIGAAQANGFRAVAVATGLMRADQLSQFKPDLILNTLEGASLGVIFGCE
jgi:phosphoglycolate phosphatase-like HAD superfamily hydrolase